MGARSGAAATGDRCSGCSKTCACRVHRSLGRGIVIGIGVGTSDLVSVRFWRSMIAYMWQGYLDAELSARLEHAVMTTTHAKARRGFLLDDSKDRWECFECALEVVACALSEREIGRAPYRAPARRGGKEPAPRRCHEPDGYSDKLETVLESCFRRQHIGKRRNSFGEHECVEPEAAGLTFTDTSRFSTNPVLCGIGRPQPATRLGRYGRPRRRLLAHRVVAGRVQHAQVALRRLGRRIVGRAATEVGR